MSLVSTTVAEYVKESGALPNPPQVIAHFYVASTIYAHYTFINTSNLDLDTTVFPRGSMISISTMNTCGLAVNTMSSLAYSDFDKGTNSFINLPGSTYAMFLKIHTRLASPVDHSFQVSNVYNTAGTFNVVANTNSCSNTVLTTSVIVTADPGRDSFLRYI